MPSISNVSSDWSTDSDSSVVRVPRRKAHTSRGKAARRPTQARGPRDTFEASPARSSQASRPSTVPSIMPRATDDARTQRLERTTSDLVWRITMLGVTASWLLALPFTAGACLIVQAWALGSTIRDVILATQARRCN